MLAFAARACIALLAVTGQSPSPAEPRATAAATLQDAAGRAHTLLDEAKQARDAKELALARTKTREAIDLLLARPPAQIGDPEADLLAGLGAFAFEIGDLAGARAAQARVCEHRESALPDDHPELQRIRQQLATTLRASGDLGGARALQERVIETLQRTLPADDVELQKARMILGTILYMQTEYGEARTLLESVLESFQRTLPDDHASLQFSRQNLALVLKEAGEFGPARDLEEKVLAIREKTLPEEHPDLLAIRMNYALTLRSLGELRRAHELLERVLIVRERTLPEDHPQLQVTRQNLAVTLMELGDVRAARSLGEKVLAVRERTLSEDHHHLQVARQNLSDSLLKLGDVVGARILSERVLAARERTLPDDHPELQKARGNLAAALSILGDVAAARALRERALAACERSLPDDHPVLQSARKSLANFLSVNGEREPARKLIEKVLSVEEERLPEGHPVLEDSRIELAQVLRGQGELDAARAQLERSIAALEGQFPGGHPALLHGRSLLASTLVRQGDFAGGRALYERCLSIRGAVLPPDHANVLSNRAELAWTLAQIEDEAALAQVLSEILEGLSAALDAGRLASQREHLERAHSCADVLGVVLSILATRPEGAQARRAFELVERTRDTGGQVLVDASDPEIRDVRLRALEARARLNDLAAETSPSGETLERLVRERDDADRALRRALADRGAASSTIETAALAAALPAGSCAVGYRRYDRARIDAAVLERRGEASLLAHVLLPDGRLRRIELGSVAPIAAAAERWRKAIGKPLSDRGTSAGSVAPGSDVEARRAGEQLRALVLDPVLAASGGASELFVCLDDALHLVPLEALPLGEGLAGDRLRVHVEVSFARLLGGPGVAQGEPSLLAVGGIDYGAETEAAGLVDLACAAPPMPRTADAAALRGEIERNGWEDLPGAREEVRALADLFDRTFETEAVMLQAGAASKAAFFARAPRARYVHLATHGWFAPDDVASIGDPQSEGNRRAGGGAARNPAELGLWRSTGIAENVGCLAPMTLCGLALAGANRGADARGRAQGVLTAEELAGFDLSRCELAVLSACETNVGVARAGLAVQSLQAALHAAGARTAITSLWKVPDEATKELMLDFYRRIWVEKEPKAQSLWEAKKRLRDARDERGLPRYSTRDWAAWVLTGEPD